MPELPEVETVVRSLAPLKGRLILNVEFGSLRVLRGASPRRLAETLRDRRVMGVTRRGKFILIVLEPRGYLVIHLGMTGRLLLEGERGKHTHAIFTLDRGALVFNDSRQFGCVEYGDEIPARILRLGPEPLEVSFEDFFAALQKRKTRIKTLLLDQRFVRGVGNIYADESLFRAGIHPLTVAGRLSAVRARKLHGAIVEVLTEAIAAGGSSISDYVDAEGRRGFFQMEHRVYQRRGEPCVVCGSPIHRLILTGRSSHFCPKCQKR
jgi:formamidopyrimidine-DNA glycosylase